MAAWRANEQLAQGNALGFYVWQQLSPYKGKSIDYQRFCPYFNTPLHIQSIALG